MGWSIAAGRFGAKVWSDRDGGAGIAEEEIRQRVDLGADGRIVCIVERTGRRLR
ncbi:MAG: hypothetical protein WC749_16535 [Dehalococcoidia bacterium]